MQDKLKDTLPKRQLKDKKILLKVFRLPHIHRWVMVARQSEGRNERTYVGVAMQSCPEMTRRVR